MSGNSLIIISTIFSMISLILFIFFFIYLYLRNLKSLIYSENTIYYFDLNSRRVKKSNINFEFSFKRKIDNKWIDINSLFEKYKNHLQIKKGLRNIFDKLEKGSIFEEISFIISPNEKDKFKLKLIFRNSEDEQDYILSIKYKKINEIKKDPKINIISRDKIISNKKKYKGFIALNVNHKVDFHKDNAEELIYEFLPSFLPSIKNKIDVLYFVYENMIIFFLSSSTSKDLKRKINKFKVIYQKKYINSSKKLFNGNAIAISNNIRSYSKLNLLLNSINFLIVKSLETKQPFKASYDLDINNDEMKEFINNAKIFRYAIKMNQISFDVKIIKKMGNNKKIINYVFPSINSLSSDDLNKLLIDRNNKKRLVDKASQLISIDCISKTKLLINVNQKWLLENYLKLKFKEAVYIIEDGNYWKELLSVIQYMKSNGFIFGMKLENYSDDFISQIQIFKPKFLIISDKLKNNNNFYDQSTILNLIILAKITDSINIKTIYQNPPMKINKELKEHMGVKLYFKQ